MLTLYGTTCHPSRYASKLILCGVVSPGNDALFTVRVDTSFFSGRYVLALRYIHFPGDGKVSLDEKESQTFALQLKYKDSHKIQIAYDQYTEGGAVLIASTGGAVQKIKLNRERSSVRRANSGFSTGAGPAEMGLDSRGQDYDRAELPSPQMRQRKYFGSRANSIPNTVASAEEMDGVYRARTFSLPELPSPTPSERLKFEREWSSIADKITSSDTTH